MNHAIIKTVMWLILLGAVWIFPFLHVYRSGKFIQGVGLGWAMTILSFLAVPLLVDLLILPHYPELVQELPEANGAVMAMGFGWVTGMIVSGLAMAARKLSGRAGQNDKPDEQTEDFVP